MHSVAVIGLGRIASGYDAQVHGDGKPRSHIGAINAVPDLRLMAAVDPMPDARDTARKLWGWGGDVQVTDTIAALPIGQVDVVALCTPVTARLESLRAALSLEPRVVLIEKPLATTPAEADEIADLLQGRNIQVRVNFHRRFDPGHADLHRRLQDRIPTAVVMRYSKGLLNYGSHLVDFLLHWWGNATAVRAIGQPTSDPDPLLSFQCDMAKGFQATVIGIPGTSYDQFEIDLFYPDEKIELRNGGVEKLRSEAKAGLYYPGYSQLDTPVQLLPPIAVSGLTELYSAVCDHLAFAADLPGCTVAEARHGQAILAAASASATRNGATVNIIN